MTTRPRLAALVAISAAVSLAACGNVLLSPSPSLFEGVPSGGMFHLTAEPPTAPRDLTLRYFEDGQPPSSIFDTFVAGATVVVDRPLLPGVRGIELNGHICDGRYTIESNDETDIKLIVSADGCGVLTIARHPSDQTEHSNAAATLFITLPRGSSMTIRLTTPGLVMPTRLVPADESGAATVDAIPAGSYEVALIIEGKVVTTVAVTLAPGEERVLKLAPPNPARTG